MTDQVQDGHPATGQVTSGQPANERLAQENHNLLQLLLDREREIAELNGELAETNKGVVALYAELDDKAQALREASDLKSRFLSYMSHEFRTPLGAIRSLARLLLDRMDGPLSDEQEKQVMLIQRSAIELSEMVDDLLDLAKIEAGRISVSPAWFEMVDLFSALRGMFKPLLTMSTINLAFEEPREMPRIYTDDKRLSQILRNFISNAIKFTLEGEVRVRARPEGDDAVTFSVTDTGIGIAEEFHALIFQDFVQIDSPLQRKWRGTGLGLSLSKKIAGLLGGSVSMTSQPGAGSTFSVTIPIRFEEARSAAAQPPRSLPKGEGQIDAE
ncbi:MAG TPA: ATP-binding protein [Planctomycetaceae bacterium]|nr:ATP-binding protein [Planctomycetaceae bacterium]